MSRQMWRQTVPVDDTWHTFELTGPIVKVDTRYEDYVEFWYLHDPDTKPEPRTFRVAGDDQPLPATVHHIGTAITPGWLVWHLMEHQRPGDGDG